MSEEARAEAYRRAEQARADAALRRYLALAGQATAYAERLAATSALRRDEGWEPVRRLPPEAEDAIGN